MMALRPLKPVLATSITPGTVALFNIACGAYDHPSEGPESLHWRCVNVVDLSGDSAVRAALRLLDAALNHVDILEHEVLPDDLVAAIGKASSEALMHPLVVVLVLGEFSTCGMTHLNAVLSALEVSAGIGERVVVAEDPASWGALPSVRGYVQTAKGRLGVDATQVTLQAVSLIAPVLMAGIDLNDWCVALGDVDTPSTLARAFWQQTESHRSLHFLEPAEQKAVESADAVAAMPLYPCTRIRQMNEVVRGFAALLSEEATLVLSAPGELIRTNEALNGPHESVLALCRPLPHATILKAGATSCGANGVNTLEANAMLSSTVTKKK